MTTEVAPALPVKPVVHYTFAREPIKVGGRAWLGPVFDHHDQYLVPAGAPYVTTSRVVSYDEATGNFETMNTRYVKS